ncbi:MAG: hypothetical protein IPO88_28260 [Nannocystis sp.]|uniref:hypothetical protein n=1 Tax=Nannocystis sp. TaxID=1962667 RepID=UPI00242715C4|nr:hypothetical protein [Nannocystis sp.]MBK9757324.1 hypothetical protein [Nannocystis sp.]
MRVSVDEGHALEVLDMLCRGRAVRIVPGQPVAEPRAELVELAGRRIAASCMRALALSGRRERVVLRAGRRVRGRIWDAARSAGFRLRFTAASFELWVQTTQRLAEVTRESEVVAGEGGSKRVRRQIRRIIKIAETDTGDWLLYALAVRHLGRVDMPPEIREELGRRLSLGSPLATLFALEDRVVESELTLAEQLDRLIDPSAVVLVECLDDLLAAQWAEQVTAAMRVTPGERRIDRLDAIGRVFEVWVDRLDANGRLDLCRSLVLAFARLLAGAWAGEPEEVAQRVLAGASLIQRAQRDALLRALARVLRVGERMAAAREQLAREGFGDPRYEEAQLVLELHEELLRPQLRPLAALVNRLTGRIG